MNTKKMNFWKRIYFAITDFRFYPYAQKESAFIAIGYFIKLLLLLGAIWGVNVLLKVYDTFPNYLDIYYKEVPEFNIEQDMLNASDIVSKKVTDELTIVVNDDVLHDNVDSYLKTINTKTEYYFIMIQDRILFSRYNGNDFYNINSLDYSLVNNKNKIQIGKEVEESFNSIEMKVALFLCIMLINFLVLLISVSINLVMFYLVCWFTSSLFGNKLKFLGHLKIILYACTLSTILEVISLVVVGSISEAISFVTMLITIVYVFYACRAIKLEYFISRGFGKTPEERFVNGIANAQKDLEKKIEELDSKNEKKLEEVAKEGIEQEKEDEELQKLKEEMTKKEEEFNKAKKEYEEALKKNEKDE